MSGTGNQSLWGGLGVGVGFLPNLGSPACWPAYAGLLSWVGLGFLISTVYLLPLTVAFLVLALTALVFRANKRQGYGPFFLGLVAAGGGLLSKISFGSNLIVYSALGLFVLASVWDAWPLANSPTESVAYPECLNKGLL